MSPPLPSNRHLKIEVLPNPPPPLFENLVGGSSPPAEREGAHYAVHDVPKCMKLHSDIRYSSTEVITLEKI